MNWRSLTTIVVFFALLAAGAWYVEEFGDEAKARLQTKEINSGLVLNGRLGTLLLDQGGLVPIQADPTIPAPLSRPEDAADAALLFAKKRQLSAVNYSADPGQKGRFPSTEVIAEDDFEEGWGLISVVVADEDLYSESRGIFKNKLKKGRQWERLGYATYFKPDQREPAFETGVGVRVHGGSTRHRPKKRLRLYFRSEYGLRRIEPGVVFSSELGPQNSLVVRRDNDLRSPPYNSFASPMSFFVARRIGALAPGFVPVRLYLNGSMFGYYYLTEHQSEKNLALRLGHDNFEYHIYKSDTTLPSSFVALEKEIRKTEPLTMEFVRERIDLDNLVSYLVATVICATNDSFQGLLFRDNNEARPLWRWVAWDMDHSFIDFGAGHKQGTRPTWAQESWEHVLSDRDYRKRGMPRRDMSSGDLRRVVFTRLLYEDPRFKRYLYDRVEQWLEHEINEEFFVQMAQQFRSYLKELYPVDRDEFFVRRREFVKQEMYRILEGLPYEP